MRFDLLLATFFGLVFATTAFAPAAPVPPGAGLRYFYPTRIGDRMVYIRDDTNEFTNIVAKVEKVESGLRVTTNFVLDDKTEPLAEKMEVSAKGVQMIGHTCRRAMPHPYWPLKYTPDADGAWTCKWPICTSNGDAFAEQKFTAAGWETVEVPAGKFRAVRVDQVDVLEGRETQCTSWYALDVGLVKWTGTNGNLVLKSFTHGPN